MALAVTNQTSGTGTIQTATTASVAFANSTLYLLTQMAHSTSGAVAFIAPVGGGLTWTLVKQTASAVDRMDLYCAYVDSGASTGTVALDSGQANTSRLKWSIESVTGSSATAASAGANAIVQSAVQERTAAQSSSLVTLANFNDATNNVAFGVTMVIANLVITPETNYTSLSTNQGTVFTFLSEYILGQDTSVTSTFTSNTTLSIGAEIAIAVAANPAVGGLTGSSKRTHRPVARGRLGRR